MHECVHRCLHRCMHPFISFVQKSSSSIRLWNSCIRGFKGSKFESVFVGVGNLETWLLSKVRNSKNGHLRFPIFRKFSIFQILRYEKICSKDLPYISCIFWSKFMTNTGFKGPLRVQQMSKFWKFQKKKKK